ncbi:MAG: hypothetical protein ACHQCF_02230 [Solirubrobacterales bacterium]
MARTPHMATLLLGLIVLAAAPGALAAPGDFGSGRLQPDGKAVVAAAGYGGSTLARFEPGGAINLGFGSEGITAPMESWGSHASVSTLSDGSIAMADRRRDTSGLIIARQASDGTQIFSLELPG